MAVSTLGKQVDIHICDAELVRIFDLFGSTQDVFVQMVVGYDDGTEKVVGRTRACVNGNLHPRWDEHFKCGRDAARRSKTLILRVSVDKLLRSATLRGEAELDLDDLWTAAARAERNHVALPLLKRGERTGVLNIA